MNARDPKLPLEPEQSQALAAYAAAQLGRADRAGAHRLHRHPGEEPDVRRRLAGPRLPRPRGARRRRLGGRAQGAGPEARGAAPGRAHAADLLRRAGHARADRRRDRGLLRPPGQAARVQRLAPRPRAVDAEVRERQALRPRRRRRRLCGVRRDHRDRSARRAGHRAAALRRPDRDLRGKRLVRPAGLPGRAARAPGPGRRWWCAWTAAPAATTSCG